MISDQMVKYLVSITFCLVLMCCSISAQSSATTDEPKQFRSDGCSLFPDGNYRHCCVAHDKDYYYGGTSKERAQSDLRLYRCIKAQKGWYNNLIAPMVWVGVRVGGVSFLPTPFRWGFGKTKEKKVKNKRKPISPVSKSQL